MQTFLLWYGGKMKKLTLELTNEEYMMFEKVARMILETMNPVQSKPKKWIRKGHYIINTKTGAIIDSYTKKRVYNVHIEDI